MSKILIVDDDREIASLIGDSLYDEGYETLLAYDGEIALEKVSNNLDLEMIILDIMMPKVDGLEVCRKIREKVSCPIIFVSAKSRTLDTVLGLEIGADDYITKPFIVDELVARVKAHLRREKRRNSIGNNIIKIGEIEIHKDSYEVYLNKELIVNSVWGSDFGDIGTVAVNIKSLRDKIDKENKYIKTIWGVGYKLIKPIGEVI